MNNISSCQSPISFKIYINKKKKKKRTKQETYSLELLMIVPEHVCPQTEQTTIKTTKTKTIPFMSIQKKKKKKKKNLIYFFF